MIKKLFILLSIACAFACTDEITIENNGDSTATTYTNGYITLSLADQDISTRSGWEYDDYFPSGKLLDKSNAEARKIYNETIIIFDKDLQFQSSFVPSLRDLYPRYIDNTPMTNSNEIDGVAVTGNRMTTGAQYFYGLINAPATYFSLLNTQSTLKNYSKDKFENFILEDVTIALLTGQETGSRGYTMFNAKPPEAYDLAEAGVGIPDPPQYQYYPPSNEIHLELEWVFAKVSVAYLPLKDGSGETHGKLIDVQYRVVNNPKQIRIFHNPLDDIYETPHYKAYKNDGSISFEDYYREYFDPATDLSDEANKETNWFAANTWKNNTDWTIAPKDTFTYCMENNNEIKIEGNSTCVLIRGQYIPDKWLDANGDDSSQSGDGTFWRIKKPGKYTSGYYNTKPDVSLIGNGEAIEYPKGITYYPIWLKTDGEYMVKRNNYYKIALTSVVSAGEPNHTSVINPTNLLQTSTRSVASVLSSEISNSIGWQQNN